MKKRTSTNNIEVTVRVRPSQQSNHSVPSDVSSFSYPTSIVVGSNQNDSFQTIGQPLLSKMNHGYNTTLLAYGQTGSGKTYTVFGPTGSLTEASLHGETTSDGSPIQWGIFPRIALAMITASNTLKASAIEIYNNSPFDLLNNRKALQVSRSKNAIKFTKVRSKTAPEHGSRHGNYKTGLNGEHPGGCSCRDCFKGDDHNAKEARKRRMAAARGKTSEKSSSRNTKSGPRSKTSNVEETETRTVGETLWDLNTPADVAKFARQIESSRIAHGHDLNERSSRSHCLVRLQSTSVSASGTLKKNCFTFIDLAGSERISKSKVEGQRMSEAIIINGSLTVLGRCIRAVGKNQTHVPWRDSVLTQLLRTSFAGQSATHTSVVVNVSPEHRDETLCTLRFGETVSCVSNKATVVVGRNASNEMDLLKQSIQNLQRKKKEMEKNGQGCGFVKNLELNHEREMLENNMLKLETLQSYLADLKIKLVETRSDTKRNQINTKIQQVTKDEYNMSALVWREKSIKALWNEGSPHYHALVSQILEKENELRMITGMGSKK